MRNITKQTIEAFYSATKFKSSSTEVIVKEFATIMTLHGNKIAYRYNDPENTFGITTCGWNNNTTKEMLNGLSGVRIQQKKGKWYLNGNLWDGKLIGIK